MCVPGPVSPFCCLRALSYAAETALTTFAFLQCGCLFYQKLRCNKRKTALQHWKREKLRCKQVALSCCFPADFQAPTFRLPRLGPADPGCPRDIRPNKKLGSGSGINVSRALFRRRVLTVPQKGGRKRG